MKRRDRKNLDKAKEQCSTQLPLKTIEIKQKKEVKFKGSEKEQKDTEELNVLMNKEKANKIIQFVREKTEGALGDIVEKLEVVKCLDSFYNKFYADCLMKFKDDKREKTFAPELLQNKPIMNQFENCIAKIKELKRRRDREVASDNTNSSHQRNRERTKNKEKSETKESRIRRCRSKSRARNLISPKKSPKKQKVNDHKHESSKQSQREKLRSRGNKPHQGTTQSILNIRDSDCFISEAPDVRSNASHTSTIGRITRSKNRREIVKPHKH